MDNTTNHNPKGDIDQEEISSPFTCEICIEPMQSNNKFNNNGKCIHPFCEECIAKYIRIRAEYGSSTSIQCPGLNCKEQIVLTQFRSMIPQKSFVRLCDKLCEAALLELDRCYCPNKKCNALIVNECGDSTNGTASMCPECKKLFCFNCKIDWHSGYRCEDSHKLRNKNDRRLLELIEAKKWTRCPACGQPVERTSGCKHVTCRCNTMFCYDCGKKGGMCTCPLRIQVNEAPQVAAANDGTKYCCEGDRELFFKMLFFAIVFIGIIVVSFIFPTRY